MFNRICVVLLVLNAHLLFAHPCTKKTDRIDWEDLEIIHNVSDIKTKYGYDSMKLHAERFLTLCKKNECDFMKIVSANDHDEASFRESIAIQNKAAEQDLAVPVLHMGTFRESDSDQAADLKRYFFMISRKAVVELEHCSASARDLKFFVESLAPINIVHADLDTHAGNVVCLHGEKYLIDFDLGYDLGKLAPHMRTRMLALEKFCTLQKKIEPISPEIAFLFNDKALLSQLGDHFAKDKGANVARVLPECLCRKKNLSIPGIDCDIAREKIFSPVAEKHDL